jgi:hypothetical protein
LSNDIDDEINPDEFFAHGSQITRPNVIDPGHMIVKGEYALAFGNIKGVARAHMAEDGSSGHIAVEIEDSPVGPFRMTIEAPRDTIDNARDFAAEHNVIPKVMMFLEKRFGTRPVIQHLLTRG